MVDQILVNRREVAELCGLSARTIDKLRHTGRFPKPLDGFLDHPRWRRVDIETWLEELAKAAQEEAPSE